MSSSDSESDGDERDAAGAHVELGFVTRTAPPEALAMHALADWSRWDGGKAGGAPSWLLPSAPLPALPCAACGSPLALLLQIYCPLDEHEQPDAFHRALYLFVCKAADCTAPARSARALRAQLPRENVWYARESGAPDFSPAQARARAVGCALCGQHAPLTCGRCRVARYCGQRHQREHWTAGGHKRDCARCAETGRLVQTEDARERMRDAGSASVFPELAIEIDAEPDAREAADEHEARLLADFERRQQQQQQQQDGEADADADDPFSDASAIDVTQQELNEAVGALPSGQDAQYVRFLTRVALAKDQVLRYARWQDESVLWVHDHGDRRPLSAPACPRCGGPRRFEFQVLPQLLFYLRVDADSSLQDLSSGTSGAGGASACDFGTLAVYTCAQSCPLDAQYADEFVHFQPPYAGT